jgi:hypothetical protein
VTVHLTAPHPEHGQPGKAVDLDDPQAEADLVLAGYAVRSDDPRVHRAASKPAKKDD